MSCTFSCFGDSKSWINIVFVFVVVVVVIIIIIVVLCVICICIIVIRVVLWIGSVVSILCVVKFVRFHVGFGDGVRFSTTDLISHSFNHATQMMHGQNNSLWENQTKRSSSKEKHKKHAHKRKIEQTTQTQLQTSYR